MNFNKSHMPSLEFIRVMRKLEIGIYRYILKTLKIKEGGLLTKKIYGDGNCLFRSIRFILIGTEVYNCIYEKLTL